MKDARYLKRERFTPLIYMLLTVCLLLTMILCVCIGSVRIAF